MPVQLFPNWVVKFVRYPSLRTKHWLNRPVEVFHVSPKMTKLEIKEYLVKLYNLPVSHVHTAIYEGRKRRDPRTGQARQDADFKKAYVYLQDEQGLQKPRYHMIDFQKTPEALAAWPSLPHRVVEELPPKKDRPPDFELPPRDRNAARQGSRPLNFRPYDSIFPDDQFGPKEN